MSARGPLNESPEVRPPRAATWLLEACLPRGARRAGLLGDLEELYRERRAESRFRAAAWYWRQAAVAVVRCHPRLRRLGERLGNRGRGSPREPFGTAASILRLAARRLAHAPGFTLAATATLALGVGATVLVFSVTYGVTLSPLPYPEAERLVVIQHPLPGFEANGDVPVLGGLLGQVLHYRERSRTLAEVGGYWVFDAAITEADDPEYVRMGGATAGFFDALGVEPAIGRLFDGSEPTATADVRGTAVLSESLWQHRFGAAKDVPGDLLETQGFDYEIVGVLPGSPAFPPERIELWNPIPEATLRDNPQWTIRALVARTAAGVSADDVERELATLIAELPRRFPQAEFRRAFEEGRMEAAVTPLRGWLVREVERPLWLLLGAALVMLTIAWVNVAGLVAVRAAEQGHEIGVKVALGAGRRHIAAPLIAESFLLAGLGGLAGAGLAAAGLRLVVLVAPAGIPRLEAVRFGMPGVVLALLLGVSSAVLLAAVALISGGRARRSAPGLGERIGTAGVQRLRTQDALVAAQLALSIMLLAGAGLVLRSAVSLARVDTGFAAGPVLTFQLPFPARAVQDAEPGTIATPFYEQLAERVAALPGVTSVGYGNCVPLSPDCALGGTTLRRDDVPAPEGSLPVVGVVRVSPGYFEALSIPLLAGRDFEPEDHRRARGVVLVNAAMAARFWPEGDAVGRRLVQDGQPGWGALEVVGVVGDVRFDDLRGEPEAIAYLPVLSPVTPQDLLTSTWVVRAEVPPASLAPAIRGEVASLRPGLPVAAIAGLADVAASSTARLRMVVWLLGVASILAVALSAVGVYGVVAYVAHLRRRELGIRRALGAQAPDLRVLIMRRGATAALAGIAVGLVGATLTGRVLSGLLFAVSGADAPTLALVALILAATAVAASLLPAVRASRVDPLIVIRGD